MQQVRDVHSAGLYLSHNIYNMDEAGFERAGQRRVRRVAQINHPRRGQAKPPTMEHLTVVACVGTSDAPIPPLIIFKGDCIDGQESWTAARDSTGAEMVACITQSSWNNSVVALQCNKHFDLATKARGHTGRAPRLLYHDGHRTHSGERGRESGRKRV